MLRLISHTAAVEQGASRSFSVRSEQSFDEVGIDLPRNKVWIGQNSAVQRDRGLDAFDDEHLERPLHAADSFCAVASLDDQLCYHRIVVRRNDGVGISSGIHANSRAPWCLEGRNASRPGECDSSTNFWCRRCTLHSRSPRWITFPCWSPST